MSYDLLISNGNLAINNGDLAQISGVQKLEQDLLKIALTESGSNPLQPWYGSLISKSLIGTNLPSGTIINVAQSQLNTAISNLQKLQNLQVSSGQVVDPREQIAFIKNISIIRNATDPRVFNITIQILNRAFGLVQAEFNANNT